MATSAFARSVLEEPLRSIEVTGGKLRLLLRWGDVEVFMEDVGAYGSVSDASLWNGVSWHLVVEGRARFQQGRDRWEVLPYHSLGLTAPEPYRVVNPAAQPLRLLSIVLGASAPADAETPVARP